MPGNDDSRPTNATSVYESLISENLSYSVNEYLTQIGKLVKYSSPSGFVFLVGYFCTIRFMPDLSLGQGAFVAILAGFIGWMEFVAVAIVLSAPAWLYHHMFGLRPHEAPRKARRKSIFALAKRSFLSQIAAISLACILACWPSRHGINGVVFAVAVVIALYCAIFLYFSPRIALSDGRESAVTKFLSIVLGLAIAIASVFDVWLVHIAVPEHAHDMWRFVLMMLAVVILGCFHVLIGVRETRIQIGAAAFLFAVVMALSGTPSLPFQFAAYLSGIAELPAAGLIVPHDTCLTIKLSDQFPNVSCPAEGPARIGKVELLNTLGSRWLIRNPGASVTLAIPGKDISILRN